MSNAIREVVIPCSVRDGMFSNERFVEVHSDDGARTVGFADESLLVPLEDGGYGMRATRTGTNEAGLEVVALKFQPEEGVNQARFRPERLTERERAAGGERECW